MTGPDGKGFRGAFVQAKNLKTKITVSVLSDNQGTYRIENLPAGDYRLQLRAIGFNADPKTGVTLAADQNATHDLALQQSYVRCPPPGLLLSATYQSSVGSHHP